MVFYNQMITTQFSLSKAQTVATPRRFFEITQPATQNYTCIIIQKTALTNVNKIIRQNLQKIAKQPMENSPVESQQPEIAIRQNLSKQQQTLEEIIERKRANSNSIPRSKLISASLTCETDSKEDSIQINGAFINLPNLSKKTPLAQIFVDFIYSLGFNHNYMVLSGKSSSGRFCLNYFIIQQRNIQKNAQYGMHRFELKTFQYEQEYEYNLQLQLQDNRRFNKNYKITQLFYSPQANDSHIIFHLIASYAVVTKQSSIFY